MNKKYIGGSSTVNANVKQKIPVQERLNSALNRFKDRVAIDYGEHVTTYSQLDHRSDDIARGLIDRDIPRQSFIGLLIQNRAQLITAILGVLKAGCVFVPLDTTYPEARLQVMIDTTDIPLVITDTHQFQNLVPTESTDSPEVRFISLDELFHEGHHSRFDEKPNAQYELEDKVYIYFTSGTTGTPKAVIGRNKGLLHFLDWEIKEFRVDETWRFSQLTNTGFDVYLRDILTPICVGASVVIPPDRDVILDSSRLVRWLDTRQINLSHCVPTLFRFINQQVSGGEHFKSLKNILLAGEKVDPGQLREWYGKFGERIQLVNMYGPTETTLAKVFYRIRPEDAHKKIIPLGKPIPGSRVLIMDENMNILDDLVVGELWIRTPYRSHGYYNDPELNKEKFIPNPANDNPNDLLYRTGDIGRILPDGNIELRGRVDRQVKIRGMRVELEEVERMLLKNPCVREAAVIKKEASPNNIFLAAFLVENEDVPGRAEINDYLYETLPDYMVPSDLRWIDSIPRKPNLKTDFQALDELFRAEEVQFIPAETPVEKKLSDIWRDVLDIDRVGVNDNFFQLGGNSLHLTSLIFKIHEAFHVRVTMKEIFGHPLISRLARLISNREKDSYQSLEAVEQREYYPLSSAQKRLYVVQRMDESSVQYNIFQTVFLEGELRIDPIQQAVRDLIRRHDSFRTSFKLIDGTPFQFIADDAPFSVQYIDMDIDIAEHESRTEDEIMKSFIQPFDLTRPPLLQLGFIRRGDRDHILMFNIHHIIADGVSSGIMLQDFMALYHGRELAPLNLQYKDFAQWQDRETFKREIAGQEAYWLEQFKDEVPVLNMPLDYGRPAKQTYEGKTVHFPVDPDLLSELSRIALEFNVSLFMLLSSIFYLFMSKITGSGDIVFCYRCGRTDSSGYQACDRNVCKHSRIEELSHT